MIVNHLSRIVKSFIFFLLGTTKLAMNAVFGKTMEQGKELFFMFKYKYLHIMIQVELFKTNSFSMYYPNFN